MIGTILKRVVRRCPTMTSMIRTALMGFLAPLCAFAAGVVQGAIVSHEFTGHVIASESFWSDSVPVGTLIQGQFSYDTATPDNLPGNPTYGGYVHAASPKSPGLTIQAAPLVFASDPTQDFLVNVFNNHSSEHDLLSFGPGGVLDPIQVGKIGIKAQVDEMALLLRDRSSAAFASDSLPTALALTDFGPSDWDKFGFVGGEDLKGRNRGRFYFTLDSLTSTAVPEPSSLVLWSSLGTMGLFAAWRRRRNAARRTAS